MDGFLMQFFSICLLCLSLELRPLGAMYCCVGFFNNNDNLAKKERWQNSCWVYNSVVLKHPWLFRSCPFPNATAIQKPNSSLFQSSYDAIHSSAWDELISNTWGTASKKQLAEHKEKRKTGEKQWDTFEVLFLVWGSTIPERKGCSIEARGQKTPSDRTTCGTQSTQGGLPEHKPSPASFDTANSVSAANTPASHKSATGKGRWGYVMLGWDVQTDVCYRMRTDQLSVHDMS